LKLQLPFIYNKTLFYKNRYSLSFAYGSKDLFLKLKSSTFVKIGLKVMQNIRKHRNILIVLLIALFLVNVGQACQLGFNIKLENSGGILFKTGSYAPGNTPIFRSEGPHHHILFWPVKVLPFAVSSLFITVSHTTFLFYISGSSRLFNTVPSLLKLICKLQI
jgi:hypothetical protein